jgi:hypothetical protein
LNNSDNRCCGSGVCIINAAGECWCGQVWNGKEMISIGHLKDTHNTETVDTDQQNQGPSSSED